MKRFNKVGGLWAFACVAIVGALIVQMAWAEPPPPDFTGFKITNTTGMKITNLKVKFSYSKSPYTTESGTPIEMSIPELDSGCSVELDMTKMWCVMKINVTASCGGKSLGTGGITINAKKDVWPGSTAKRFSGFAAGAPDDGTAYPPRLEFFKKNNRPNAKLSGKWRWDENFPDDPVVAEKLFN